MVKTCGWCGDLLSQGERHDECANALRDLAVRQEAAASGAAFMAEYLLEESAINSARADMVSGAHLAG